MSEREGKCSLSLIGREEICQALCTCRYLTKYFKLILNIEFVHQDPLCFCSHEHLAGPVKSNLVWNTGEHVRKEGHVNLIVYCKT